ncbi:unnamed protein product [Mytilus edulis]|uniref:Uncharacterized protein n=1 Tax=Mytilus edulis TaxID=6550 RepID=A0A8S3TMH5_MYTED|nr:unnamed protein product [Mytilus edulis]
MLARADAVKKETVLEPEETIMISDSEEEIVMQPEIKKKRSTTIAMRPKPFLIKKEYFLNYDIILAKVMIDKIARSIIWFSETITEEEEHSSNKPEQSDIHTADSETVDQRNYAEQSNNQTVGHLDCDPAEQQQCSSPVKTQKTEMLRKTC